MGKKGRGINVGETIDEVSGNEDWEGKMGHTE